MLEGGSNAGKDSEGSWLSGEDEEVDESRLCFHNHHLV
jgi:hypothetical protein